jgi:hypothetical protein
MMEVDPAHLDNPTLCRMLDAHGAAIRSAHIVFSKTVVLAMGTNSESNHAGFSCWAVENMDAVEGWRQFPELWRTFKLLKSELDKRIEATND